MNNRNFSKAVEAVSPVVATLLLVLVAAGAAIGFGVFLNNFQKKTQNNVSSDTPQETLHIGGSSTVFELTEKSLPAWKAAHPSIAIDDQEGGSDAGLYAICHGTVDIGTSSKIFPASGSGVTLANCPDTNNDGVKDAAGDMHITVVGYDGVAIAWNSASSATHCSAMDLTVNDIRELYGVNGASQVRGTDGPKVSGAIVPVGAIRGTSGSGAYTWGDLRSASVSNANAAISGANIFNVTTKKVSDAMAAWNASYAAQPCQVTGVKITTGAFGNGAQTPSDSCTTATDNTNPCFLNTSVAAPAADTKTIILGARSDNSGTEDGFCNKVLGYKKDGIHCSNDANDQMIDSFFGSSNLKTQQGNDGLATFLDGNADALSFIGYGAVATDANLKAAAFGADTSHLVTPSASVIKAAGQDATTLAKDAACANDISSYTVPSGEYCAVRPLQYITAGAPSATEQLFLDFMLQTLNNVNFNKAAGYVSIYS